MFVFRVNTPARRKASYSRRYRLTREGELEVVKRAGKRLRTEHLEARAAVSLLSYCRVAVVVAKHGHKIAERNLLRRRIRELIRVRIIPQCFGVDMMIRALPDAYDADFNQLGIEIEEIRTRLAASPPET